jgi:hypothetical protein
LATRVTDPVDILWTPGVSSALSAYIVTVSGVEIPVTWGSTTLGTVTPLNRSTGQLWTVNLGAPVAPLQGDFIIDSTATGGPSGAWVLGAASTNVAIISQPVVLNFTIGALPAYAATLIGPAGVGGWASGDTFAIYTFPAVFIRRLMPGVTKGVHQTVIAHLIDEGGNTTINDGVSSTEIYYGININSVATQPNGLQLFNSLIFAGSSNLQGAVMLSGGILGTNNICKGCVVGGDAVVSTEYWGESLNQGTAEPLGVAIFGNVGLLPAANFNVIGSMQFNGANISSGYPGSSIYGGTGGAYSFNFATNVGNSSSNGNGSSVGYVGTATNTFLGTPTFVMSALGTNSAGSGTGCSVTTAAVWHCGIAITPSSIDASAGAAGFGGNVWNLQTGDHIFTN